MEQSVGDSIVASLERLDRRNAHYVAVIRLLSRKCGLEEDLYLYDEDKQ